MITYNLFDTLLEPVFVLDREQKVIYCNQTAAILANLSLRKITRGLKFDEVLALSEPLEALKNLSAVTEPLPYRELGFTTQNGETGKVQIALQPLSSETEPRWIVFVRDVTLEERLQKKYRAELNQKEDVIQDLERAKLQLEDYSKNLETMVASRTHELSQLNQTMSALLDSLGQGFFIFGADGQCHEVTSKACIDTIETIPAGKKIWDVLKLPAAKVDGFKRWMTTIFSEMLPFSDLAPLGPTVYPHSENKDISLEYFPLRSEHQQMEGIVVVATDITSLVEAKEQAEIEKAKAKMIIHFVKSKREIARLIRDARPLLSELNQELQKSELDFEAIYRHLHTLKGGAASFSIHDMIQACHLAEDQLQITKQSPSVKHDKLMKSCEQIELSFNNFLEQAKDILGPAIQQVDRQIEIPYSNLQKVIAQIEGLPRGAAAAEILVKNLVMEPVETFFAPYKDLAFKWAANENKPLQDVVFLNSTVPVLPEIYTHLFATFVHAFRNAIDHGLRTDSNGKITVLFELIKLNTHSEDMALQIIVRDNGIGIDPQKIRAKLAQKNISTELESDTQVIQHIFDSQFSTREVVSETAGRGVGMDAIRFAAESLGGHVEVSSRVGHGTDLIVRVPYLTQISEKIRRAA